MSSSTRYDIQRLVCFSASSDTANWAHHCTCTEEEEAIEKYRQLKKDNQHPEHIFYRIVKQTLVTEPHWVTVKTIQSNAPW